MNRSMKGMIMSPMPVASRLTIKVMAMVVWTALLSPSRSCAPYRWEIMTDAPVARPAQKPTMVLIMEPVEPTAACASWPTNWPTTTVSTVLYNC